MNAPQLLRRWEDRAELVYRRFHPGPDLLADFDAAPPKVQADFWKQLGAEVDRESATALRIANEYAEAGERKGPDVAKWNPLIRWDKKWRKRAGYFRKAQKMAAEDSDFERQREYLRSIPAAEFVARLTGEDVTAKRPAPCPLHDERTASFTAYEWIARCYGCGFRGDVYEFAGALWDIDPKSSRFRELHTRLYEELR